MSRTTFFLQHDNSTRLTETTYIPLNLHRAHPFSIDLGISFCKVDILVIICYFFCVAIYSLSIGSKCFLLIFATRMRWTEAKIAGKRYIKDSPIFPVHSHASANERKRERDRECVRDDIGLSFWGYVHILRNYHRRCIRLSTHGIEIIWTVLHAVHSIRRTNNNFVCWLKCKNKMR